MLTSLELELFQCDIIMMPTEIIKIIISSNIASIILQSIFSLCFMSNSYNYKKKMLFPKNSYRYFIIILMYAAHQFRKGT